MSLLLGVGIALASMANATQSCPTCNSYSLEERSVQPSLSIEARGERFGLMLSYGQARRESDNYAGPRYFANTDPQSAKAGLQAHIQQTIEARWLGLQGTYLYRIGDLGLRLQGGFAHVWGSNYERGTYDYGSGPYLVSHRNSTQETRPIYGAGLEYQLSQNWLGKAEWQHIEHVVESRWTLSNRIDSVGVQLVRRF